MELQVKSSTPPEVLEERRKIITEASKRIEEAVALRAKEVEQVSQLWEALIDDEELEKVTEQLCIAEAEVNQLKNEVKNLLIVEKMAKASDMKKLQQHVSKLGTQ